MKHEPATPTHDLQGLPPTVIHHPEENDTLLAQWLRRAIDKGPIFWVLAGGTLAVILGVGYLVSGLMAGESESAKAWSQVMLAKSPEDLQRIAETESKTQAGEWAALMAASSRYREGLSRLPADQEAAKPILTQALEGFKAVEENARGNEMLRRLALLGIARTHETRDELDDAIATYEKIAKNWPETEDGKESAARVKRLKEPEAIAFYKRFSEYKPKPAPSTTIGPRGSNALDLPPGHPSLNGPTIPAPALPGGVPAGSVPSIKPGELPPDVFQKDGPTSTPRTKDDTLPDVFPDLPKPKAAPEAPK